jgi:hypothetical protein
MTKTCAVCGAEVAGETSVCPRCGYPFRGPGLPVAGGNQKQLVPGLWVGGVFLIFVMAFGIALLIPRLAAPSPGVGERAGVLLLRQAYTAEWDWWARHGSFAPRLEDMDTWDQPDSLGNYQLRVGTIAGDEICLEAVPRRGAPTSLRLLRMNPDGSVTRGATCAELTPAAARPDPMLEFAGDVAAGVKHYREEHERAPTTLAELVEAYPRAQDDPDFEIALGAGPGGMACYNISSREAAGPVRYSLDADGKIYPLDNCRGNALARSQLPADPMITLMRELGSAVADYERRRGAPPVSDEELASAFPRYAHETSLGFTVAHDPAGAPCYVLELRNPGVFRLYSIDRGQRIYRGGECTCDVIDGP